MRFSVFGSSRRTLARSAAILLIAGASAGCSQQVSRFGGGIDDIFTASTPNQRQIIKQDQPFPGDAQVAAAPVAPVQSGSVTRGSLTPVTAQPLPAPTAAPVAAAPAPTAKPIRTAAAPAPTIQLDQTPTGTVAKAEPKTSSVMASLEGEPEGWSRAGGTQITAKEGETVYNLSRRFGVPANVIMKVNELNEASGLQAGQKVIIPTYVYSSKAPVSAPDSNPNVADAKSSTGTKYDIPADKVPVPTGAPQDKLAVLPNTPKVKEGEAPAQVAASTGEAKASTGPGTYTVAAGDTLSRISRKTGVGVNALKSANGLQDGLIRIGQTLTIPAGGATVASAAPAIVDKVTTGTAAASKEVVQAQPAAYTPPKKTEKLIEQSDQEAPDATGIGRMRWPVRGRVISAYSKSNDGIDIQVPEGTPVKAAENGVVIYAGDGLKEFGNTVLVRHEDGLVTVYGHASELKVARGQKVKRGEEIARSGMSGTTDAPKLHFEVRKNSAPVDPTTFLE
jgi:murein DD-endopeptidase MepM/ murein hydrolase activator NlpD